MEDITDAARPGCEALALLAGIGIAEGGPGGGVGRAVRTGRGRQVARAELGLGDWSVAGAGKGERGVAGDGHKRRADNAGRHLAAGVGEGGRIIEGVGVSKGEQSR